MTWLCLKIRCTKVPAKMIAFDFALPYFHAICLEAVSLTDVFTQKWKSKVEHICEAASLRQATNALFVDKTKKCAFQK